MDLQQQSDLTASIHYRYNMSQSTSNASGDGIIPLSLGGGPGSSSSTNLPPPIISMGPGMNSSHRQTSHSPPSLNNNNNNNNNNGLTSNSSSSVYGALGSGNGGGGNTTNGTGTTVGTSLHVPSFSFSIHPTNTTTTNNNNTAINHISSGSVNNIIPINNSSGMIRHISDKHAHQMMESLHNLRSSNDQGELCDVTLIIQQRHIRAHKVILAACSPYFRAMFTGELAESKQTEITLHDVNEDAIESLVEYCYTSIITVEVVNVQHLLPAACLLQMNEIQEICCQFLKRQLDPSNCLGIKAFADTHDCRELLREADKYTLKNFQDVMESEEFLLLPRSQLIELICNDELSVRSEEQVYQAVLRWVRHNLSERQQHLFSVLKHVRLPLLPAKFLVGTVSSDPLLRNNEACRDLIDEAKNYLLLPQERSSMQGPRTRPRKPCGEVLFAVGGWCNGDAINTVERYDPRNNEWRSVSPMCKRRCGVGVAVVQDLLYAVGGHDGQSYLNSVERYDPHTNQWSTDVAPTSSCRTSVGVAVLDGLMYAVGGQDGVSCLNYVECYDPIVNVWSKVSSMNSRRLGVGVAVLDGVLYAVGGSDGIRPLNSVEKLDPRVGKWQDIACMKSRRKHLGVAVHMGFIYSVGGRDDSTELSSAEFYDPRADAWCPVVAMTCRRSGVGLSVVNGQLMAIGGFDGCNYLRSVEQYDDETHTWRTRGSMTSRRLGGGVGVLRVAHLHDVL